MVERDIWCFAARFGSDMRGHESIASTRHASYKHLWWCLGDQTIFSGLCCI